MLTKEGLEYVHNYLYGPQTQHFIGLAFGDWGQGINSETIISSEVLNLRLTPISLPTQIWDELELRYFTEININLNLTSALTFNRIILFKNGKQNRIVPVSQFSGNSAVLSQANTYGIGDRVFYSGQLHRITGVNGQTITFNQIIFPNSGSGELVDASGIILAVFYLIDNQTLYSNSDLNLRLKISSL